VIKVRSKRHDELMADEAAAVSFERNIRSLFRQKDRLAMDYFLDLWDYEQVRRDAVAVLDRLDDATMPCDGAWDPEQIDLFRAWIDGGFQP
jgi:hypothetical protein